MSFKLSHFLLSILCNLPLVMQFMLLNSGLPTLSLFVLYVLLVFLVLSLLQRFHLLISLPLLLCSGLVSSYFYASDSYIPKDAFLSVLESDAQEALEFASSQLFINFTGFNLVFVLICIAISKIPFSASLSKKYAYPLCLVSIASCIHVISAFHEKYSFHGYRDIPYRKGIYKYYPVREYITIKQSLFDTALVIRNYEDLIITEEIKPANNNSIILVIGEAARADVHGAINPAFNRPPFITTPFISGLQYSNKSNVIIFKQAITVSPYTRIAVPSLLSFSTAEKHKTLGDTPSLYKAANTGEFTPLISATTKTCLVSTTS